MLSPTPYLNGKLPAYADYVVYQVRGPAASRFERWVRQGMHLIAHSSVWEGAYSVSTGFCYLYHDAGQVLAGRLWPSRDRVGRKHPFWVGYQEVLNGSSTAEKLSKYPQFFSRLQGEVPALIEDIDAQGLPVQIEEMLRYTPRQTNYAAFASHITLEKFLVEMLGLELCNAWREILVYLAESFKGFDETRPYVFELGVRLPLRRFAAEDIDIETLIRAWTELVCAIAGARTTQPQLFWTPPTDGHVGQLAIFFVPPKADVFPVLLDWTRDHINVCDPVKGIAHLSVNVSVPDNLAGLLQAPHITIGAAIEHLQKAAKML